MYLEFGGLGADPRENEIESARENTLRTRAHVRRLVSMRSARDSHDSQ